MEMYDLKTQEYKPYEAAFLADDAVPVFRGIQGGHDIYKPDSFDVPEVHGEARACFERLIARHAGENAPGMGSILLLKGRAGSGKTHLMRAFRNRVHREAAGYFGYLQLTAKTDNYHRYILSALVDHLQRPYHIRHDTRSGLRRLSDALAESSAVMQLAFPDTQRQALMTLREDELPQQTIIKVVEMLAPRILREERFADVDIDLIRVLLYLQTNNPVLENRVKKYLRAEKLSANDEATLGGISSLVYEDAPARMLEQLGLLMWQTEKQLLVIGVDQIENIASMDQSSARFQRAVNALTSLVNNVPSSIVVLACLEDYYISLRQHLFGPNLDRLEQDPEPLTLHSQPAPSEIAPILAKRLEHLYAAAGLDQPDPGFYPFTEDTMKSLGGLSIRDMLSFARQWQDRCRKAKKILTAAAGGEEPAPSAEPPSVNTDRFVQSWNDYQHGADLDVPAKSIELAAILEEGISYCREESDALRGIAVKRRANLLRIGGLGQPVIAAVCNRAAAGGGMLRELETFEKHLENEQPLVVRAAGFPGAASKTGQFLAQLEARGGRRIPIEDHEWRAMIAMGGFRDAHAAEPGFEAWLKEDCPLTRLPGIRALLGLDTGEARPAQDAPVTAEKAEAEGSVPAGAEGEEKATLSGETARKKKGSGKKITKSGTKEKPVLLGQTLTRTAEEVCIDPADLTRHTAFLGGTGSGKTTLAMRLIEGLLFRGIPALLLDRKGDLCGYANPETWKDAAENPALERLRGAIAPALYTPANPHGRSLRLRLLPPGMGELDNYNRGQYAAHCAASICGMMGYGSGSRQNARQSLLKAALDIYAVRESDDPGLDDLIAFLEERDPALLDTVGNLAPKTFDGLIQDLNILRINKSHLFDSGGETLEPQRFFSPAADGKTRLTVISTKFLGDQQDTEFWTARLFIELGRWISSAPAGKLQGVVFCDEADRYLPATGKPATKEPMENLLRRARSAGIGMLLATQSPGDFDYRCRDNIRTWFIGRIRENTAINKMKPLLRQYGGDIEKRLPALEPGRFVLAAEGHPVTMAAERCLVPPEQIPADDILRLAEKNRASGKAAAVEMNPDNAFETG
jgi:Cdc6-like AAA superfamily ATPase